MSVKTYQLIFCVFICTFNPGPLNFFYKSFLFFFLILCYPYFLYVFTKLYNNIKYDDELLYSHLKAMRCRHKGVWTAVGWKVLCAVLGCQVPRIAKTMGSLWVRYHSLPTRQSGKLWQHDCWLGMCSVRRVLCSVVQSAECYWIPPDCALRAMAVPTSQLCLRPWATG